MLETVNAASTKQPLLPFAKKSKLFSQVVLKI